MKQSTYEQQLAKNVEAKKAKLDELAQKLIREFGEAGFRFSSYDNVQLSASNGSAKVFTRVYPNHRDEYAILSNDWVDILAMPWTTNQRFLFQWFQIAQNDRLDEKSIAKILGVTPPIQDHVDQINQTFATAEEIYCLRRIEELIMGKEEFQIELSYRVAIQLRKQRP